MDLSVALSAFALLFLAEMGDKSQLLVMTLAHRYRPGSVIAGSFAVFALLQLVFSGVVMASWMMNTQAKRVLGIEHVLESSMLVQR